MASRTLRLEDNTEQKYLIDYRIKNIDKNAYGSWGNKATKVNDENRYGYEIKLNHKFDKFDNFKIKANGLSVDFKVEHLEDDIYFFEVDFSQLGNIEDVTFTLEDVTGYQYRPELDFRVDNARVFIDGKDYTNETHYIMENEVYPKEIKVIANERYLLDNITSHYLSAFPTEEEIDLNINSKEWVSDLTNIYEPTKLILIVKTKQDYTTPPIDPPDEDKDPDDKDPDDEDEKDPIPPIIDDSDPEPFQLPFTSVYMIDKYNILNLSRKHGKVYYNGGDISSDPISQMINNIIRLPFKIPSHSYADLQPIIFGSVADSPRDIVANKIKSDVLNLDIGTIKVKGKYENSLDYINTEVILYLPFMDSVSLPIETVIDGSIDIEYLINLYSGSVTCNIKSSITGTVVNSINGFIGRTIPYYSKPKNDVSFSVENNISMNNGIYRAYIEVSRNTPIKNDDAIELVKGQLKDVTGYVEVDRIDIDKHIIKTETDMLKNELGNGVVING